MIEGAAARGYGNQVAVQWSIPRTAAPQPGYKLEVFDNPAAKAAPIATAQDNAPYILARRLDAPREARSVRLIVRDIFDQETSRAARRGEGDAQRTRALTDRDSLTEHWMPPKPYQRRKPLTHLQHVYNVRYHACECSTGVTRC